MALNFPFGKIFLGDGGAYLAGFWLAECAVLLLSRNPSVSTWAVLLACAYPVWETGFSMYRRNVVRRVSSGRPDMVHFHHLILRRFVGQRVGRHQPAWLKHGLSSAFIWALVVVCQFAAVAGRQNTLWSILGCTLFALTYHVFYIVMVKGCQPTEVEMPPAVQLK
jgi:UDP-N-acetylmuramyl pentapeptide phosphotransferase/UDP-N-acetylglucosamine-1-phosphate transferase